MNTYVIEGQLTQKLFDHPYFFEHFTTSRGIIHREDRIRIIRTYFTRFGEIPKYAIENFFPEILLKYICEDKTITTDSQAIEEIKAFVKADEKGFFLEPEGRTNTYRGEFSIVFYQALKENDHVLMFEIIQKAERFEHMFDKKF